MLGTVLTGRYRLDTVLGQGGVGTVFRAYDTVLDRTVAVKMLPDQALGSEGRARLLREAQAAARLNHPNIVAVYDAGEADGIPFIVMELVPGPSLHEYGPLAIGQVIDIARQLCSALDHAHSHGVVHRDLKPENVLLVTDEGGLLAKVADFGLARAMGTSRLTREDGIVGSVFYLAPEQALGQEVDGRADLYALGALLFELVAGQPPYTADDPLAVIAQHLHAPVPSLCRGRPEVPAALDTIVVKLLAKDRSDRFPTARAVRAALAEIDEPAAAAPPVAAPGRQDGAAATLDDLVRAGLVGRRDELALLTEGWAQARGGRLRLVLLSGEPGIGKTRLAEELLARAEAEGAAVLRGGCYEYEAATPYLPFVEALRQWAHAQNPVALRDLAARLGPAATSLARLAPEIETALGPLPPNPPLPAPEERLRLFDHVARFLADLANARGAVLFLDDLHWADNGTLTLLHYLLRHLRGERVLIVGAYREAELDRTHPLAAALAEWQRERLATRVSLGRLSAGDTQALLAAIFGVDEVSGEFALALHHETEGNPFFLEEVVKALIESGQIYREAGQWERADVAQLALPQSVREAVSRRLDRLSPGCADVLHSAAALGKTFAFAELAALVGGEEDRLLDALDEAQSAQIIRPAAADTFSFTHDKIREVLYEELNPIRRRRLHLRIGEALARLYAATMAAHAPDLAYHFVEAGDLQRGLEYSMQAAAQAERLYAHDEALAYYSRARECAESLGLEAKLAGIHAAIAGIYTLRGPSHLELEAYQRALALTPAGPERGRLKALTGEAYARFGDERGLSYLQAALAELDPESQAGDLARTLAMVGRFHHYRGEHRRALEYLEQARRLAEPLDDPAVLADIYAYLAGAYQHMVQLDRSLAWARRCIALGERTGFPYAMAMGYEFVAEDSFMLGAWDDTLAAAARDRELAERIGSRDRIGWSAWCRSVALANRGDLAEAVAAGRESLAIAERIGDRRLAALAGGMLAMAQADLGDVAAGQHVAEDAVASAEELHQVSLLGLPYAALGHLARTRGDLPGLAGRLAACVRRLKSTDNRAGLLHVGAIHAEACLAAGDIAQAEAAITAQLALTAETGARHSEGCARRVLGQVLLAQGQAAAALEACERAIMTLAETGSRVEQGRALVERAGARLALDDSAGAAADLGQAQSLFTQCGAAGELARLAARA